LILCSNNKPTPTPRNPTPHPTHPLTPHSKDSWVVVPLASVAAPGAHLEGTRLTLVRVPGQPDAAEFSIRTPVTPPRWKLFDAELEAAWEGAVNAMLMEDREAAARGILQVGFAAALGGVGWGVPPGYMSFC
jgi:hypothetical protein